MMDGWVIAFLALEIPLLIAMVGVGFGFFAGGNSGDAWLQ